MKLRCPECKTVHTLGFEPKSDQHITCFCGAKFTCEDSVLPEEIRQDEAIESGTLIGRCKIVRKLGEGAMGSVYLAEHMTLSISVAIKVMAPKYSAVEEFKQRFYREAQIAAKLNHPNIVRVLDCGNEDGLLYLIMEYIDGGDVQQTLSTKGRLDIDEVKEIALCVASALSAAAKHHIVHRDIKPENIMVSEGTYKLADLGLAKQELGQSPVEDANLTQVRIGMGTPLYMSPEQAVDAKSCDGRSDIYALGATMYHLLCGRPPFPGKTTYEILTQHIKGSCSPPGKINPDVPPQLEKIIGRCMMKRPEDRYQTADDLWAALDSCASPATQKSSAAKKRKPAAAPRTGDFSVVRKAITTAGIILFICVLGISAHLLYTHFNLRSLIRNKPKSTQQATAGVPEQPSARISLVEDFRVISTYNTEKNSKTHHILLRFGAEGPMGSGNEVKHAYTVFHDKKYKMKPLGHGHFSFFAEMKTSLPDMDSLPVHLVLSDKKTTNSSLSFKPPLPGYPKPLPMPMENNDEKSSGISKTIENLFFSDNKDNKHISFPFEPIKGVSDARYSIEIGTLDPKSGDFQKLSNGTAAPGKTKVLFNRRTIIKLISNSKDKSRLFLRYIASKNHASDTPGVTQRCMSVTQVPLAIIQHMSTSKANNIDNLKTWTEKMNDQTLTEETKIRLCQELWKSKTCTPVDLFTELMTSNGTKRYWLAYTLANICRREKTIDAFQGGLSRLEQRRIIRSLNQLILNSETAPPEGVIPFFKEL